MAYVYNPNGSIMVATRPPPNIPANLRNLNKRDNFNTNMVSNLRNSRNRGNLLKFIMYAYYMAWWAYRDTKNNNTRKQLHKFDKKYRNISTRAEGNHSMITPKVLWDRLQPLSSAQLREFARILEW